MLRHPLTVTRLASMAAAFDWLSLPILAIQSVMGPVSMAADLMDAGARVCFINSGDAKGSSTFSVPSVLTSAPPLHAEPSSDALCQASLTFVSIYPAVMLPVLSSILKHKPSPQQSEPPQQPGKWLSRLCQLAARAASAVDRWLASCLPKRQGFWHLLVHWWVFSYAWELSKTVTLFSARRQL